MKRFLRITACVLALSAPAAAWPEDFKLHLITEDAPVWNYLEDGQITGLAVDMVREIQRRVGDTSEIAVMPWAKGYDLLQKEPNAALFVTARAPWRESLFQWVGPVGFDEFVFVARADNPIEIKSLDDAKKVRAIAAYKEDVREQFLKENGFTNLDISMADQACLNKLLTGRVDLWLMNRVDIKMQTAAHPNSVRVVYNVETMPLFVAFSKGVPAKVVKQWQDALDKMKDDGTYRDIYDKWYCKVD
jgi:polar amino acid transport system substrate-binding protein